MKIIESKWYYHDNTALLSFSGETPIKMQYFNDKPIYFRQFSTGTPCSVCVDHFTAKWTHLLIYLARYDDPNMTILGWL